VSLVLGRPVRRLALGAVALTGVVLAALTGALTNAFNGWVSPRYFVTTLGWRDDGHTWRDSIAQGAFEGLLFGAVFALVFTVGVGILTRASCTYRFAARHLLAVVVGALVCWLLGGAAAMLLATLSPEFYRRTFIGVPVEVRPMLAYAWVGGSIWGLEIGGLVSVVLGLVVLRANWSRVAHGPLTTRWS
jgi:hypothetical protein